MRDRFYQFSWRPRPPSLLPEAQLKDIVRNLRKYSEKYAKEDDVLLAQVCGRPQSIPTHFNYSAQGHRARNIRKVYGRRTSAAGPGMTCCKLLTSAEHIGWLSLPCEQYGRFDVELCVHVLSRCVSN